MRIYSLPTSTNIKNAQRNINANLATFIDRVCVVEGQPTRFAALENTINTLTLNSLPPQLAHQSIPSQLPQASFGNILSSTVVSHVPPQ